MQCQLVTITLAFVTALAIGLVFPIVLPPGMFLRWQGIQVIDGARVHVHAAVRSTQRMTFALPCLLPPLADLPFLCGRPLERNLGRPSCIGAMELLLDQQALGRRLVSHTLPSGDFLTPLNLTVNIVEDILDFNETNSLRRCITAIYHLSEHMRLAVSR